jgi:hypothetical protein
MQATQWVEGWTLIQYSIHTIHPNPIYPNNFLQADLNILVSPTLFVLFRFEHGLFCAWYLMKGDLTNFSWVFLFSRHFVT